MPNQPRLDHFHASAHDSHANVRLARASFAYLFELGSKNLRLLVTTNGPESIYADAQGLEEISVWTLRRELRGTPPAQLWEQANDAVAAAARAGPPRWPAHDGSRLTQIININAALRRARRLKPDHPGAILSGDG